MNWIITKVLRWGGERLNGYKTRIGGAGLILLGVVSLVNLIWPDTIPGVVPMDMDGIIGAISGGFVALGLGHKLDKNTEAVNGTFSATIGGSAGIDMGKGSAGQISGPDLAEGQ